MAAPEGYTKLGNVGYADKGVYSADATYNKYNAVYHEGSTYVALKDNLHGVTPADGANWRYMAKGFTEASADAITVIDTSGIIDGTKNKKTILQTFLDKVGDFIINKAVTNDALMLKLADYVAKTDIVQVESTATDKVPSSAYIKQALGNINSNLDSIPLIKYGTVICRYRDAGYLQASIDVSDFKSYKIFLSFDSDTDGFINNEPYPFNVNNTVYIRSGKVNFVSGASMSIAYLIVGIKK